MDAKTFMKKLDLSWVKLGYLMIFNNAGLYEYVLQKINTAINLMLEANGEGVDAIRERLGQLIELIKKYSNYIPTPWLPYADAVNVAIIGIYEVTEDHIITSDEASRVVGDFRAAYSAFMAD